MGVSLGHWFAADVSTLLRIIRDTHPRVNRKHIRSWSRLRREGVNVIDGELGLRLLGSRPGIHFPAGESFSVRMLFTDAGSSFAFASNRLTRQSCSSFSVLRNPGIPVRRIPLATFQ